MRSSSSSSHHRSPASALAQLHRTLGIPPDYAAKRRLALQGEAKRLVEISRSFPAEPIFLTPLAAAAWHRMRAAAERAQIALLPVSGFRSVERQAQIVRAKLARGMSLAEILRVNAAPGYSEHHSGRALDLAVPDRSPLEEDFADTSAFHWLSSHAAEFGFRLSFPRNNPHQIAFEPWHWCWYPAKNSSRR